MCSCAVMPLVQDRPPTPRRVPGATPDAPPSPRSDAHLTSSCLAQEGMPNRPPFPPDKRSWRERKREDPRTRVRDRTGYLRPDRGNRPTDQRVRDRTAYARPDQGKRPNHHSGGHNKKQRVVKQEEEKKEEIGEEEEEVETLTLRFFQQKFKSQEGEEAAAEEEDEEQQKVPRTCNKPFGCGSCFCDQCYPPGNALGRQR